jgi:hypothetical protein
MIKCFQVSKFFSGDKELELSVRSAINVWIS